MGNFIQGIRMKYQPDIYPQRDQDYTHPLYGFPEGVRIPRKMVATNDEMQSLKMPAEFQDYCAHLLLDVKACHKVQFPFMRRCEHLRRIWNDCRTNERIDRMKDYERERRLMVRKRRIEIKRKRAEEAAKLQEQLATA